MDINQERSSFLKKVFIVLLAVQLCVVVLLQLPFGHVKVYHSKFHTGPRILSRLEKQNIADNTVSTKLAQPEVPKAILELDKNPVYERFKIPNPPVQIETNLLIIVSSAPRRIDRRSAIRDTWWTQCKSSERVKVTCVFMTDYFEPSTKTGRELLEEEKTHKDIAFQKLKGGVEFGRRFLYHMIWAMKNYKFDYFMRMDDDYFFCLERFLHELPLPMRKLYHWGYVHCLSNIVRPEESIILLSNDLIKKFLKQDPNVIKGHPWADQMIATWVQELNIQSLYNHDPRLHHHPPLREFGDVPERFKKVCTRYIGVHGSYPKDMRLLWTLREGNAISDGNLDKYSGKCKVPQIFDWRVFGGVWRYEPKKLIDNPVWDTTKQKGNGKDYGGREEGQNK
eukprot:gene3433-1804_t